MLREILIGLSAFVFFIFSLFRWLRKRSRTKYTRKLNALAKKQEKNPENPNVKLIRPNEIWGIIFHIFRTDPEGNLIKVAEGITKLKRKDNIDYIDVFGRKVTIDWRHTILREDGKREVMLIEFDRENLIPYNLIFIDPEKQDIAKKIKEKMILAKPLTMNEKLVYLQTMKTLERKRETFLKMILPYAATILVGLMVIGTIIWFADAMISKLVPALQQIANAVATAGKTQIINATVVK